MDDDGNVIDFGKMKFAHRTKPDQHQPITALREAVDWLIGAEENGTHVDHVIVLFGRTTPEGASGTKFFQAGKYPHHAQMGLCSEGALLIRETGDD